MATNVIITGREFAKVVTNDCKLACNDIASAKKGIMYYVNLFNKLSKKNGVCKNVNLKEFGRDLRLYCINNGIDVPVQSPYNAYVFTKDRQGRPCYIKCGKKCPKWGMDIVKVCKSGWCWLQPVTMTERGVLNAYKYIIKEWLKTF